MIDSLVEMGLSSMGFDELNLTEEQIAELTELLVQLPQQAP